MWVPPTARSRESMESLNIRRTDVNLSQDRGGFANMHGIVRSLLFVRHLSDKGGDANIYTLRTEFRCHPPMNGRVLAE